MFNLSPLAQIIASPSVPAVDSEGAALVRSAAQANGVLSCGQAVGQEAFRWISCSAPEVQQGGGGRSQHSSPLWRGTIIPHQLHLSNLLNALPSKQPSLRGQRINRQQWPLAVLHSFLSTVSFVFSLMPDIWGIANQRSPSSYSWLQEHEMGDLGVSLTNALSEICLPC